MCGEIEIFCKRRGAKRREGSGEGSVEVFLWVGSLIFFPWMSTDGMNL